MCAILPFPDTECPVRFPFSLRFSTTFGTAGLCNVIGYHLNTEVGTDYRALNLIVTFPACGTRRCVDVIIVDDSSIESEEYFMHSLRRTSNLDSRISIIGANGMVSIRDNDG